MSREAVRLGFDFLADQNAAGSLHWNQEVADRFAKLLGSGYVRESIRSLWPLYPADRRPVIGYLLETAEQWRSCLRRGCADRSANDGFVELSQLLLKVLEGQHGLTASLLQAVENGHIKLPGTAVLDEFPDPERV
jgi:hypothetical protein